MGLTRNKRATLNACVALLTQGVTMLCGFVVPKLMIGSFGSEAYGATASIAQFLAYITLLEGGIGGVARAALYKPLAENNIERISIIVAELRRFFGIIACVFLVYVIGLAGSFTYISGIQAFDWATTFLLVVVISISTFAQYFIGVTYAVLLQAAQRLYINNLISAIATILNTVIVVIMVKMECSLLAVKFMSSCIFVLRPLTLRVYVKRKFPLIKSKYRDKTVLKQKWAGLGQHVAYFLHSNTDIMVLTVFANLTSVAVYSVYHMIISHIQSFAVSSSAGMEAHFGDMLAKKENKELDEMFSRYETLISVVAVALFATTAILIAPFVKLYTAGITDAEYHAPLFSFLMIASSLLYCLRHPYHAMIVAAGHFKQTQFAAYGEAFINIFLSTILVLRYGLIGVAIGTIVATAFRLAYYVYYLNKHILYRSVSSFLKRFVLDSGIFAALVLSGKHVITMVRIDNYLVWMIGGIITVLVTAIVTIVSNYFFYKKETVDLLIKK